LDWRNDKPGIVLEIGWRLEAGGWRLNSISSLQPIRKPTDRD
jgi:hypothetical protein